LGGFEFEVEVDDDVDVPDAQQSPPLHDQPDPMKTDVDPTELEKELEDAINQGIKVDAAALQKTAAGAKLARLWFVKKKRAKLTNKVARLRRVATNEKGTDVGGRFSRSGTWSPQNPVRELDVARTFGIYGAFIPGVTTQRQRHRPDPTGRPTRASFSHMNFILDLSGSMAKGVSPTYPLDVRKKESADDEWVQHDADFNHTGEMLWLRSCPLVPDPAGPAGGYPKWEVRVAAGHGLPDEGRVLDPTEIRRVCDVSVEIVFAMLQEAQKRKNTVSIISFDTEARVELSRSRDYAQAEKVVISLEPDGGTLYKEALQLAVHETKEAGGKALTVLVTDAHASDLVRITPGAEEEMAQKYDEKARDAVARGTGMASIYRDLAKQARGNVGLIRELVKTGPFFLVCLGQDPAKDANLRLLLSKMRSEYGASFEVGVFPDVSTEDAVFQAARWSVRL
jgi:hypothetical protein